MNFSKNSALQIIAGALAILIILFGVSYTTKAIENGPDWVNGNVVFELGGDYAYHDGDQYWVLSNVLSESITAKVNSGSLLYPRLDDMTRGIYPTSVGYFNGYYALPIGETRWQTINRGDYAQSEFIGNPGDTGALVFINNAPNSQGQISLHYILDWRMMFGKLTANYQGNVSRSVSSGFDISSTPVLKKPDGSVLPTRTTAAPAFSKNGQWLYLNSDIGQLRAHIPDLAYQIMGPRITDTYSIYSAVSNDGRFVVTGSKNNLLTIYDKANCAADVCLKRELLTTAKTEYAKTLPGGVTLGAFDVVGVKFIGSAKLEVYVWASWSDGTAKYIKAYISTDAGAQPTKYLALGDSFSSGEGAGNYYEATNFYISANNYNVCHQSRVAYSELLSKVITPDQYDSIACSGAQMKDVIYGKEDDYINSDNWQAKSTEETTKLIQSVKQSNLPGYIPQLSLVKQDTSSLASISIGGNDIGFGEIVKTCMWQPGCYSSRNDREKLADLIDSKIPYLEMTYKIILSNMIGDSPRLYVVGYPQLFNQYTICGSFMSGNERDFANRLVDYLNEAVRIAAKRAGAVYADVSTAFLDPTTGQDHRLCGDAPPAANGTFIDAQNGSDTQPVERYFSSSYHPNALGQQLLASRIELMTNYMTREMPLASTTESKPNSTFYQSLVGDNADQVQDIIDIGQFAQQTTMFSDNTNVDVSYYLDESHGSPQPGALVTVVAQSTPVTLGTMTIQNDGLVEGSFELPSNLEMGVHTLHLKYTDISGRLRDIVQYIDLFATREDLDGDGIPNNEETCAIGNIMGIDLDHDGVDDACDSGLTEHPPVQTDETSTSSAADDGTTPVHNLSSAAATFEVNSSIRPTLSTSAIVSVIPVTNAKIDSAGFELGGDNSVDEVVAAAAQQRQDVIKYVAFAIALLIIVGMVAMYFVKRKRF